MSVTRRRLLARALYFLGLGPVPLGCASARAPESPPAVAEALSDAELDGVVAFGELVVEGRPLAAAARRHLLEHIIERAGQNPRTLALYRDTAATLDRLAGRRFATLDVRERIDLVARHDLARLSSERGDAIERVVPELISGYYTSPAGWGVVGYETFPGRCGDLTRYTRPEPDHGR